MRAGACAVMSTEFAQNGDSAEPIRAAVCTENLNPEVVVVESAEDGACFYASGALNRANGRRIFVQRPMRSDAVIIACVRSQDPSQMGLTCRLCRTARWSTAKASRSIRRMTDGQNAPPVRARLRAPCTPATLNTYGRAVALGRSSIQCTSFTLSWLLAASQTGRRSTVQYRGHRQGASPLDCLRLAGAKKSRITKIMRMEHHIGGGVLWIRILIWETVR
jgi:hypothetical protein